MYTNFVAYWMYIYQRHNINFCNSYSHPYR